MMKKWIALVLSAIMVLSICGCGKTEAPAAQEAQTQIVETVDITGKFAVGFGRADISPKEAVPISGITANGTDRMSTSIHDTLYVSCIAMTDENGDLRNMCYGVEALAGAENTLTITMQLSTGQLLTVYQGILVA